MIRVRPTNTLKVKKIYKSNIRKRKINEKTKKHISKLNHIKRYIEIFLIFITFITFLVPNLAINANYESFKTEDQLNRKEKLEIKNKKIEAVIVNKKKYYGFETNRSYIKDPNVLGNFLLIMGCIYGIIIGIYLFLNDYIYFQKKDLLVVKHKYNKQIINRLKCLLLCIIIFLFSIMLFFSLFEYGLKLVILHNNISKQLFLLLSFFIFPVLIFSVFIYILLWIIFPI